MARIACFLLLAASGLYGCALPPHTAGLDRVLQEYTGKIPPGTFKYRCTMGAHRGESLAYTENTMEAFKAAQTNEKFAFIEFDVQLSADNQAVVFHDKSLRRTFGRGARIEASTFQELVQLTNGGIARYQDVMDLLDGCKLNIEIKSHGNPAEDEQLVNFIVADIDRRSVREKVMLSSISPEVVKYINRRYPEIPTGRIFWIKSSTYLPFDSLIRNLYEEAGETDTDYIMLHAVNLRNIEDLLRYKPESATLVFWAFDDTMYLVHKDFSDRLWGDSWFKTAINSVRYKLRAPRYRQHSTREGS